MQKYIGVKEIKAVSMNKYEFKMNVMGVECLEDNEEGYLVEYTDGGKPNHPDYAGYVSWSPKTVFERAYRLVDGLTFGQAIEAMKAGKKVARAGWNGKGMWIVLIHPGNAIFTRNGDGWPMQECIGMKTADKKMQPGWLASQTDMLSEDWQVV